MVGCSSVQETAAGILKVVVCWLVLSNGEISSPGMPSIDTDEGSTAMYRFCHPQRVQNTIRN